MVVKNRATLLAAGLAGLVFAAGASADLPRANGAADVLAQQKERNERIKSGRAGQVAMPRTTQFVPDSKKPWGERQFTPAPGATFAGKPTGRYFVRMKDPSVVRHMSALGAATSRDGSPALDLDGTEARRYETLLVQRQDAALTEAQALLRRPVQPALRFTKSLNGFSVALSAAEAKRLEALDQVDSIQPVVAYPLDTDVGPEHIGAPSIWNGTATGDVDSFGDGVTVGIIDSGINSDHPSFAETVGAYTHTNPLGSDTFLGYCDTPAGTGFCNDKLIGAYDFVFALVDGDPDIAEEASPEDNNGHGSHTASTVAGNSILVDFNGSVDLPISGVAPRANIIAYDVCYTEISTDRGLCPGDASAAAVEQAIDDGIVEVINFSIGGGVNPYNDLVSEAFLAATEVGIYVAASAGNSGPDAGTLGHQEPWVSTTAASTHFRVFAQTLGITAPTTPPELTNVEFVAGSGTQLSGPITAEVEYSGEVEPANVLACAPFTDPNAFAGKVALVARGTCGFVDKVTNAQNAGAIAVIVHNSVPGAPFIQGGLDIPAITIPSVMVRLQVGQDMAAYIASNPSATVTISDTISRQVNGTADVMADFSSRGPNSSLDVLKPDVTAPGVSILAAVADGTGTVGEELDLYQGTSMSSPHNAGAAALISKARPSWTPSQIKSALMLTARNSNIVKEDEATPADPLNYGNGRIQVDAAVNAALVMDESIADYTAANPADGGDPRQLNLASLYSSNCIGVANCAFTRSFTNVSGGSLTRDINIVEPAGVSMSASPSNFTLADGATQVVEFTADATALDPADGFSFGTVTLTAPGESDLHLNVAIQASAGVLPELVTINTRRDAGSQLVSGLITPAATDLTFIPYGMVQGTQVSGEIGEDSDNSSPFDDLEDGVFFQTFTAPQPGLRFVAEIIAAESPDFDLFIGIDVNGNGLPDEDEIIDASATGATLERSDFVGGLPGFDYWVLIENWAGSSPTALDSFTLSYAFVPFEDRFNSSVQGPAAPTPGAPFDVRVFFNEPALTAGDRWYGAFDVGPDEGGALNAEFGTIALDVVRREDDVTKTADVTTAEPGDVVTYTIEVQPNVTTESVDYLIFDAIPQGMTYVPGSATASDGTVSVLGGTLQWSLTQDLPRFDYDVTTSLSEPTYCGMPDANDGAYTDLAAYGFLPSTVVVNDGPWQATLPNGGASFYGAALSPAVFYSGNGALTFDLDSIFEEVDGDGSNTPLPTPALPNSLLAPLWTDMTIDAANGSGVTRVNFGPFGQLIEFDNLILESDVTNASRIDMEVFIGTVVDPGFPEIIYAYANPEGQFTSLTTGTIGIENQDGTAGIQLAFNDAAVQVPDGLAICFDLVQIGAAQTLTFQASVDGFAGAPRDIVNIAQHTTSNPGSAAMTASASITAFASSADLSAAITGDAGPLAAGEQADFTVTVTNAGPDAAEAVVLDLQLPSQMTFVSAVGTGWTCVQTGDALECTLAGSIASAASSELVITLEAETVMASNVAVTVSAVVSATTFDPDTSNNDASTGSSIVGPDAIFTDGFED